MSFFEGKNILVIKIVADLFFVGNRPPEFKKTHYNSEIKENANVGDEILKVLAFDADLDTCVDEKKCPCGRIKYSISKGNEDGLFHINTDSGVISLAKKPSDQYHSKITLSILAENEGDLNTVEDHHIDKSLATVDITVKTDHDVTRVRRSLHHRTRRSVTVSLPPNLLFSLAPKFFRRPRVSTCSPTRSRS